MLFQLICLGLAARVVSAVPAGASLTLQGRDNSTSDSNVTNSAQPSLALFQDNSTHPFSLPARDNSSDRAAKIQQKRLGFLYGPSPVNDASYFPAGPLGQAVAALDIAELNGSVSAFKLLVNEDVQGVVSAAQTVRMILYHRATPRNLTDPAIVGRSVHKLGQLDPIL